MQPVRDPNVQVGANVAALRTAAGQSQADLAALLSERLGKKIDPTTVTRLEGGKRPITVTELLALSAIYDVSTAFLLPAASFTTAWSQRWSREASRYHDREAEARAAADEAAARSAVALAMWAAINDVLAFQDGKPVDVAAALRVIVGHHTDWDSLELVLQECGVPAEILAAAADESPGDLRTAVEYVVQHYFAGVR